MHRITRDPGLYSQLIVEGLTYAYMRVCAHVSMHRKCTCWGQVGSNLSGLIILVLTLKLKMTKEGKTNYRVVSENNCWVNFTQENGILGEKPIEGEGLYLLSCSSAGDQQALMHAGQMLQ